MDVKTEQPTKKVKRNVTKPSIVAGLVFIIAILPLIVSSTYILHIFILALVQKYDDIV